MDGTAARIGDVDLDDLGHPVALGVLFQIETGRDTQRYGRQRRDQHDQQGTDPGRQDACLPGTTRGEVGEEIEAQSFRAADDHVTDEQDDDGHTDG